MSAAKKSTRPSPEKLAKAAEKAGWDFAEPLLALSEIGSGLRDCTYPSNTMWCVVEALIARVRAAAARLPTPSDPKVATAVREYVDKGFALLDDLQGAAQLLEREDDNPASDHPGVAAIGTAIETFSEKAGGMFEGAGRLLGASPTSFCFHTPADFQGTSLKDFRRSAGEAS